MPLDFDGSADYIHWDAAHIAEGSQLTFMAWMYPDVIDTTFRRALHFRDANVGFKFVFVNESSTLRCYVVTGNATNLGNSLRVTVAGTGQWYHVIGTKATDHTLTAAWLNGTSMTDTGGGTFNNGTDNDRLTIGARSDGNFFFNGVVMGVVVWASWLPTAAEATALSLGANPLKVGPTPVHCAMIPGLHSTEPDIITQKLATHVSAPPFIDRWAPIRFYSFGVPIVIPAAAGGVTETEGSSSGAATVDGISGAIAGVVGESAGLGAGNGLATAFVLATGTSDGLATVTGQAAGIALTTGSVDGLAVTDGIAAGVGAAIGDSIGLAVVSSVSGATAIVVGTSIGLATVNGQAEDAGGVTPPVMEAGIVPVRYIVGEIANVVPVETVLVADDGVVPVREFVGPANVVPVRETTETPRVKVIKT